MYQATDVVTTEAEIRSVISGQFSSQQGKIVDHSQDANCVECFQIDAGSGAEKYRFLKGLRKIKRIEQHFFCLFHR